MAGNLVISQINGGPIGVINAIINGNFQVNQRGVSGTVSLSAGAYGHDRWKAGSSGCTYTFSTTNNVTTLTITAGSLIQVIEGINLYSGTYTLSWSGTAQGKIGAGSYAGSGVSGSVTGGTNLNIEFGTGTLSLVQFEPGTESSPFERRDYGRELMMCQRYYAKMTSLANFAGFGAGLVVNSTSADFYVKYPVQMRAAATVGYSTLRVNCASVSPSVTSLGTTYAGSDSLYQTVTASGGGMTAGQAAVLVANNSTAGYLDLSAEL